MTGTDIIDRLVGIEPGSTLDTIRSHRPQARENGQASFSALFEAAESGPVSAAERRAIALFVAGLHQAVAERDLYAALLEETAGSDLIAAVDAASQAGEAEGPGGRYPPGPLEREGTSSPAYSVPAELRSVLGGRLSAAFAHAHMLTFQPREADPANLDRLLDAGWTTTGIVTLSQIISYLAFQIRVTAGLRALAAHPAA